MRKKKTIPGPISHAAKFAQLIEEQSHLANEITKLLSEITIAHREMITRFKKLKKGA